LPEKVSCSGNCVAEGRYFFFYRVEVSTLSFSYFLQAIRKQRNTVDPKLRRLNFIKQDPEWTMETYRDFYFKSLEISRQAYRHGVKILAGSDVPELPGSSLHDELQEMATAGISNYEVLRTATLYPAQYYKFQDIYGSVEEGKIADLILLSGNPIENIKHTRSIEGLFFEGIYMDKKQLERINQSTVKTSNSLLVSIKLIRDILIYMTI
jgi:hypothetical protein